MYQIETDISIYVCICDSVFIYMYVYYICIIKEFTINIYLSIYLPSPSTIIIESPRIFSFNTFFTKIQLFKIHTFQHQPGGVFYNMPP